MNKKILSALTAFCITLGFAGVASADCNGIYLGLRGGYFKPKAANSKINGFDITEDGWSISGAIGYRYNYVRVELEAIMRDDPETTISHAPGVTSKQTTDIQSYMVNFFWDISPYTMFTPYLMAGIGLSEVEFTEKAPGLVDLNLDDTNFTWSLGGGVSAKVTSRFNVDIGYRYFDFGKLKKAKIRGYEIYGGLRYVF